MEVILLERIPKLGIMGDRVRVKPGYARNYLFPHGKALKNTEDNRAFFQSRKLELEARNLELRGEARAVADRLEGMEFVIIRTASDTGSLYGSVSKRDIASAATEKGITVGRSQIDLNRPIKEIGVHPIAVSLHPEIDATIMVNVARTEDEAVQQSSIVQVPDVEETIEEELYVVDATDDIVTGEED